MKKLIVGGTVVAAMFGGAALGPAIATANDEGTSNDAPTTDDNATTTDSADRSGGGPRHHRHAKFALADDLGIDRQALRDGFEAGQTLAETLTANGVDIDDAIATMTSAAEAHLAEAVESGRLSQDEADAKLATLSEKIEQRLNAEPGEAGFGHGRHRKGGGDHLAALEELGLDPEAVRQGLQDGQTLAEVAEANGVSQEELVAALVAQSMERVDAAVEAGRITQEQADAKSADLESRITERVTAEPGERQERGRRGKGRRHGDGVNGLSVQESGASQVQDLSA